MQRYKCWENILRRIRVKYSFRKGCQDGGFLQLHILKEIICPVYCKNAIRCLKKAKAEGHLNSCNSVSIEITPLGVPSFQRIFTLSESNGSVGMMEFFLFTAPHIRAIIF